MSDPILSTYYCAVEKNYYHSTNTCTVHYSMMIEGVIPIRADSQESALNELKSKNHNVSDILWAAPLPGSDWEYEDFSFSWIGTVYTNEEFINENLHEVYIHNHSIQKSVVTNWQEKPFEPGEIIIFCDEEYVVISNYGDSGKVAYENDINNVFSFRWRFEGEDCVRTGRRIDIKNSDILEFTTDLEEFQKIIDREGQENKKLKKLLNSSAPWESDNG
jgi:hypothetical protein